MDNASLEKRVAELEKEVAELKAEVRNAPAKDDWLKTVGWAKDDPGFEEMMELGRKYRERQRRQGGSVLALDTNHVAAIEHDSVLGGRLLRRLRSQRDDVATTIISAEEQFRGWLAQLHRQRDPHKMIAQYARLHGSIQFFASWTTLPWDASAANLFNRLKREHRRLGTIDVKIACIVMGRNATLLSQNLRDFRQIPNLDVEDWLSA